MYILDPSPAQLADWYRCRRRMADFLGYECGLPVIHHRGEWFYFVKTPAWEAALAQAPLWLKIWERLV